MDDVKTNADLLTEKIKKLKELTAQYQREFDKLFAEKDHIINSYLKQVEDLRVQQLEEDIKKLKDK
ncbi:MAG: hypothetical protein WC310_05145 [Patescibacteria group bacterium]|jgi:hypothetical protein